MRRRPRDGVYIYEGKLLAVGGHGLIRDLVVQGNLSVRDFYEKFSIILTLLLSGGMFCDYCSQTNLVKF